jgi:hypothetical protein
MLSFSKCVGHSVGGDAARVEGSTRNVIDIRSKKGWNCFGALSRFVSKLTMLIPSRRPNISFRIVVDGKSAKSEKRITTFSIHH